MTLVAIGTFTDGFMGGAAGEGVYLIQLSADGREGEIVSLLSGRNSPSYLARHPNLPLLYAAERFWSAEDKSTGALATLEFGTADGLILVDRRRSGGAFSAHVSVAPDGRTAMLANPLGPNIAAFPLDARGLPGDPDLASFAGRGPRPRQSAPWPHSCWFSPSGRWAFACDLGLDTISIYAAEHGAVPLKPAHFARAQVSSGAGARHMAIRADGRFAYVANELDGTISTFALDDQEGTLTIVQTIDCSEAPSQPCEILCSASGQYLFVTLRGPEAIAVFGIDDLTGELAAIQLAPCLGDTPRHIALSPDGLHALVCNQLSGEVIGFNVAGDGRLEPNGLRIAVPSPACAVYL